MLTDEIERLPDGRALYTSAGLPLDDLADGDFKRAVTDPPGAIFDRPIAEKYPCMSCGGACEYSPWLAKRRTWDGLPMKPAYRAFAVCKSCGFTVEF